MAGFPLPGASGLFIQAAAEGGASRTCLFIFGYISYVPVVSTEFQDREPIDSVVAGSY